MSNKDRFKEAAVIDLERAKIEAYHMGYERFEGMEVDGLEGFDLAPFRDSAAYANHVLPSLRALAGHADAGMGTWTRDRTVAVVAGGADMDDLPIEADLSEAHHVLGELVSAWEAGVYDAVQGEVKDHDAAVTA